MPRLSLDSPVGRLTIFEEDGSLTALDWGGKSSGKATPLLVEAKRQLGAYFAGKLKNFSLPLSPAGSSFEQRVWQLMSDIPYGETRTYGDLARDLTLDPRTGAARAVGGACGRNPLPILIPCHRILAAQGLGGYSGSGGADTKRKLLILEGALLV